ncbi:MAG: hypothetical protein RBS56_05420 [Candidatus Gracilibacteria bacterium]|jgi:hypothetical protein|nr:hypothetical protein [Candidatus Gracilibacteria bacterium]
MADTLNPLDLSDNSKKPEESNVLENVVAKDTMNAPEENILDIAPNVDLSLLKGLEPQKNIQLMIFKTLFAVILVAGLISVVFFQSQLTHNLDFITDAISTPHVLKELENSNLEVRSLKTDFNMYTLLQANANLNEITYLADGFMQSFEISKSQTASAKDKSDSEARMTSVREKLKPLVLETAKLMNEPLFLPLIDPLLSDINSQKMAFELDLKEKLRVKSEDFREKDPRLSKLYIQTINLVGNSTLTAVLNGMDVDKLRNEELYAQLKVINAETVNDLSIVHDIKNSRIKWSDIIKEIDLKTMAVDSSYSEYYYDLKGGIRYTSYEFDKEAKRISIIGEILRYDTANFTMIANLIDSFNTSGLFEGAEMKSFSKSGSIDDGYKSSVRLNLTLRDASKVNLN